MESFNLNALNKKPMQLGIGLVYFKAIALKSEGELEAKAV